MYRQTIYIFITLFAVTFLFADTGITQEQYKKISREIMSDLVDGKIEPVFQSTSAYLKEHPDDLESLYIMAIVYAQKGDIANSMDCVKEAMKNGLPFGRFLAGPESLLQPLWESEAFKKLKAKNPTPLIHGPMVGDLTDHSASFWVRTSGELPFQVFLTEVENPDNQFKTSKVKTQKDMDLTAIAMVDGLKPNTLYSYNVHIGQKSFNKDWTFRTFPIDNTPAKFQVGFGGGAGYTPQYERMWTTITTHPLHAFLFLGDNVYIDHPKKPAVQKYCYYRRQSRSEYRGFISTRGIYAIWDDHDFTDNDGWGGPEIHTPAWKIPVWKLFKCNWVNPSYGGGESQPGCWFSFNIGDVDFIMLDGRYYRMDPKAENPSMLGQAQKEWLFNELLNSDATFKVLASPVPWSEGTKPGSLDTWDGYKKEREEIYSFINDNKIDGVFLICADRHRSDVWKTDRPNGYPLYEFESSKLSNIHTHRKMPDALFSYNEKCSFGVLSFDTTVDDPTVSYQIFSIDNEFIHETKLKKSQLSH